jgi:hypothetical protein
VAPLIGVLTPKPNPMTSASGTNDSADQNSSDERGSFPESY